MSDNGTPAEHPEPDLDRLRPYITETAVTLRGVGIELDNSWLDPSGPRDATIRFTQEGRKNALVWDEETGWRVGGFVSGEPGERTRLNDARYLGGGVLPDPQDVVRRLLEGTERPCTKIRSYDEDPAAFNAALSGIPHRRSWSAPGPPRRLISEDPSCSDSPPGDAVSSGSRTIIGSARSLGSSSLKSLWRIIARLTGRL